ncbi:S-adenosyl-L-methionine-dependent methyltransferase [Xylariaceae sp. FL0804]|nr:S-adenosyl-L-methionine-dependent methyltransferase [Xylariaceae sp. FL0804]
MPFHIPPLLLVPITYSIVTSTTTGTAFISRAHSSCCLYMMATPEPTQPRSEAPGEAVAQASSTAATAAAAPSPAPALEPTPEPTPALAAAAATGPTTVPPWTSPQEADDGFDDGDADSALGDDTASTTASLSASILDYRTHHGRTYHSVQGTAEHWAPNDEAHLESMDIVHHTLHLLFGEKPYLAPVPENAEKILDVGTGTGIWAIDYADAHPNSEVIGTDISPSQPEWVPPNLKFEIEDCTQEWTFQPNSFDYIHMRYLFGSIQDWDALHREAYRACKPGGWVETIEPSVLLQSDDGSLAKGTALYDWGPLFHEATDKVGRSMSVIEENKLVNGLTRAGFVDVKERTVKLPASPWPKDPTLKQIGAFSRLAMEQDLDGYALFLFTMYLGWSREQVLVFLMRVRKELHNPNVRPYFRVQAVWARKPEA